MPVGSSGSIGRALEAARARAGLSIVEVSDATRIRRTLVDSIEHDDYARCGGDFYARGHIRSIARVVGVDPEPLVAQYDAEHPNDDLPVAPPSGAAATAQEARAADEAVAGRAGPVRRLVGALRPGRPAVPALGGLLAVLLAAGVGQAFLPGGGEEQPGPLGAPAPPAQAPAPASPEAGGSNAAPPAPAGAPARRADSVTVTLDAARGRSWVSVRNGGGETLYEGMLPKGAERTFTARSRVRLVVGDAGAVDLTVNGRDLGAPGEEREVARAEFTPESRVVS